MVSFKLEICTQTIAAARNGPESKLEKLTVNFQQEDRPALRRL